MSTNYKYFVALLATALLAVVATDAGAVIITNITTNTVLFSEDFEDDAAINLGFADDTGAIDFDPSTTTGSWTISEGGSPPASNTQIQVTSFDGTSSAPLDYPGAFQGDNYLWVNRTTGFSRAVGSFATQDTDGDVISIEFQIYARGFDGAVDPVVGPDVFALYSSADASGASVLRLGIASDNDIIEQGTATDTLVDWTDNTWETWRIDLVIGESEYDLTVDGNTMTVATAGAISAISSTRSSSNAATEYFIDAIPEPSSLLLAGMCLLGIAASARRRTVS